MKTNTNYIHYIKKTDQDEYLCDWYYFQKDKFHKWSDPMVIKLAKQEDGTRRTIGQGHDINYKNWINESGVIVSESNLGGGGYAKFVRFGNEFECVDTMLGG